MGGYIMPKVMVTMPDGLLEEVDLTTRELKTTRSQFFRDALIQYLENYKKKKTESLMAEGYREMADENLADAQGFLGVLGSLEEEENG